MEFTKERKNEINYIIRFFNAQAGTTFKFSAEKNQIAVNEAIEAAGGNLGELCSYLKNEVKEGRRHLRISCSQYVIMNKGKKQEEAPVQATPEQPAFTETSALNFLGGVITNMVTNMKMDDIKGAVGDAMKEELRQFIFDNYGPITRKVEFQLGEKKTEIKGIQHNKFQTVLNYILASEPVFLTGPAGSGKNVICQQIAEVMGLDFYFTNAVTQEYKLTGFTDANGVYHETQFYKAFKNGGVFMLDEMDASIPDVLNILNAALANRYFDFPAPIGYVEAHPDFRVTAAGNTYGQGADMEYVGRNQLDAATLDRFALVPIDYDSRIEEVCAGGDADLLKFIRAFRNATSKAGIKTIVSYRSITRMAKLGACMDTEELMETSLIKSLELDDLKVIEDKLQGCGKYTQAFEAILKKKGH